jgi:hypothetical protein
MATDERRRAPRIPVKVPVKLRPTEGTTPYMLSAESINLSGTGVLFSIDAKMKVGSTIELTFTMPTEVVGAVPMKVRCTARIVRVEEAPAGGGKVGVAAHIERFETIVAEV